ncbi:MAG: peptidoglycan editing factor PgeF [Methyloprofundus sp.]|nr:peptidoglycan editing factor PgeF [Methyloprofundus sp.]
MNWITPDWPAPANIHAVTTLRRGGVSQGAYGCFNLAEHVGDNSEHVASNRQMLREELKLTDEPKWLNQTHSTDIVCADQLTGLVDADASYTDKKQCVCVVLTADCLPILLCDTQGVSVAAIHGGWRGLLNGILENSIAQLPKTELMAWLGPAIGPQCFEVGAEVRQAFVNKHAMFAEAFILQKNAQYLADIYLIARLILNQAGVEKIYGGNFCTVTEAERFFSYRREGQTGRMATLIWKA